MKVSRYGVSHDEILQLQNYAKTIAPSLRFEYCCKIHNSEYYDYSYTIDVHEYGMINSLKYPEWNDIVNNSEVDDSEYHECLDGPCIKESFWQKVRYFFSLFFPTIFMK